MGDSRNVHTPRVTTATPKAKLVSVVLIFIIDPPP
jgi:hypothetical protein